MLWIMSGTFKQKLIQSHDFELVLYMSCFYLLFLFLVIELVLVLKFIFMFVLCQIFRGRQITRPTGFPAYSSIMICFVVLFNFKCTVFMEINKNMNIISYHYIQTGEVAIYC